MEKKNPLSRDELYAINSHVRSIKLLYDRMEHRGIHLHQGQVSLAKDLFVHKKRVVQAQWGRKAGKTETSCYIAWAYALLHPGSQVWIICPQRKQATDIYWMSGRIQNFGPREFVAQVKEVQLIVLLTNGSQIRLDGCENYNALRGINPDLVIYDEFQDHSKEFHLEVMAPNLIAKDAALLVIGTPPNKDCYYTEFRTQLLGEITSGDTSRSYYEFPTSINPTLDKKELERTRIRLYKSGNEKIWLREYMGQLIYGGEGAVFSSWSRERHIKRHAVLMAAVGSEAGKLKWYSIMDPGNMTCFAVLFAAFNPYTSQLFLLDEIYETDPKRTDAKSIYERVLAKEKELYPQCSKDTFKRIYDEAAAWFAINAKKFYPDAKMSPTNKRKRYSTGGNKEFTTALGKQIMGAENALFVSEKCQKLKWEVENYVLDENGNYPDTNDHLIDCFCYLLDVCNFKFIEKQAPGIDGYLRVETNEGTKKIDPPLKDPNDWDQNAVDGSLWIEANDIFNEYLQ